jgi:hypothetical protein
LWGKFLIAGARFRHTEVPFGMLRRHADQKTADGLRTTQSLMKSALKLLDLPNSLSRETKAAISADLQVYFTDYPERHWKKSGRLARIGLPKPIVMGIRKIARIIRGPRTVSGER